MGITSQPLFWIGLIFLVSGIVGIVWALKKWKKSIPKAYRPKKVPPPEADRWWTTLYYGARGSGKSLHQAREGLRILEHLEYLYWKKPELKPAIVFSVQRFSAEVEKKYLGTSLYYWNDAKDLQYCPRPQCWKSKDRHRLHGAYLLFDDMATIFPADNWTNTPIWLRKMFSQARHFGIRVLANCQDPFSVDINFRRYTDMAFRFRKIAGSRDPDETKPPIKFIWGAYMRRKIKAELLWKMGDAGETEILIFKQKQEEMDKVTGTNVYGDAFRGTIHFITKKRCEIYDTTQDVPEYRPTGFTHHELFCLDKSHDHVDKKSENYCGYKKVSHELY